MSTQGLLSSAAGKGCLTLRAPHTMQVVVASGGDAQVVFLVLAQAAVLR
jgi:hypothetical protein